MTTQTSKEADLIEKALHLLVNQVAGMYTKYETGQRGRQEAIDCIYEYYEEALAAIRKEIEDAYERGRIDEAKICEKAQRHDKETK